MNSSRIASVQRTTRETNVRVTCNLDGNGVSAIRTPLPFLSHMLDQISRHGLFDLEIEAEGDIEIDGHHTTEDIGITLGQAFAKALGDRKGIVRYGSATLPMDDVLVTCALDLSGRSFFVWRVPLPKAKVGTFDVELAAVFFEAFAQHAGMNLHLRLHEGDNLHHILEICFKSLARALSDACRRDPRVLGAPSTKGVLEAP